MKHQKQTDEMEPESNGRKKCDDEATWGRDPVPSQLFLLTVCINPPSHVHRPLSPPMLARTRGSLDSGTGTNRWTLEKGFFRGPWRHVCWVHLLPEFFTGPVRGPNCSSGSRAPPMEERRCPA